MIFKNWIDLELNRPDLHLKKLKFQIENGFNHIALQEFTMGYFIHYYPYLINIVLKPQNISNLSVGSILNLLKLKNLIKK